MFLLTALPSPRLYFIKKILTNVFGNKLFNHISVSLTVAYTFLIYQRLMIDFKLFGSETTQRVHALMRLWDISV